MPEATTEAQRDLQDRAYDFTRAMNTPTATVETIEAAEAALKAAADARVAETENGG